MDLNLAKTFLEVVESGNFHAASECLHVTQSTVSMRIKSLEEELGRKLFVRHRSGAALTAAGTQFRLYAEVLVNTWQRACQEILLPAGVSSVLSIGSEKEIWDSLLIEWVNGFRERQPAIGLRAEMGDPVWIARQLTEGLLDLGITYSPNVRGDLAVEPLYDEKLVLVSNRPRGVMRWSPDYIYMDWGDEFREAHRRAYPGGNRPALTGSIGALGLRLVVSSGGSGYFPFGSARPYIEEKKLFIVTDAPVFERKVYGIYRRRDRDSSLVADTIGELVAAGEQLSRMEV
jgi:DNA-binding transcriptional LysR family regulator